MSFRVKPAAFFAVALLCAACAQAQTMPPSADDVLQMMSNQLNLTDAQKSAIGPVIADRQEKLRALRADGAPMRAHRREAKSILADGDRKINAVLSPDQQRRYTELERQMIERLRHRSNDE